MGVQELEAVDVMETEGGHMDGYSEWYHEQQAAEAAESWFWWSLFYQALQ
ncbi:MAG: hypothetical protein L3J74_14240 [Bacteroidales bacterium]|nr:hypothetical protein [Bacteroidales bacterium]